MKPVIGFMDEFEDLEMIWCIRTDTVLYDLLSERAGKWGALSHLWEKVVGTVSGGYCHCDCFRRDGIWRSATIISKYSVYILSIRTCHKKRFCDLMFQFEYL